MRGDDRMTLQERYEIYKSYRTLLKQAVHERTYLVAIRLKEAFKNNDYDELKRLVECYK